MIGIALLRAARSEVRIRVVVFSSESARRQETESAFARLAGGGPLEVRCLGNRDGDFPADWGAVKESLATVRGGCRRTAS